VSDDDVRFAAAFKREQLFGKLLATRDFAASALNLITIAIIPVTCLLLLISEPLMVTVADQLFTRFDAITAEDIYTGGGHNIFENAAVVLLWLIVVPASLFIPPASLHCNKLALLCPRLGCAGTLTSANSAYRTSNLAIY